ncbi:hypothetical protein QYM36_019881, partial [Artemia franciscana]
PEATKISNCNLNPDIYHSNAFCAYDDDLLGSKSVCKTDFQGNGVSCTGKGKVRPLSYLCCSQKAKKGYKGDGYACNPLVNCDDDPSICDQNARCQ